MNDAIKTIRRLEDASLTFADVISHKHLRHWGLFDTVVTADTNRD